MAERARSKNGSAEKAEREVEKIFNEVSANMSSFWLALGSAVVGGLILSTLFTLILIPLILVTVLELRQWLASRLALSGLKNTTTTES